MPNPNDVTVDAVLAAARKRWPSFHMHLELFAPFGKAAQWRFTATLLDRCHTFTCLDLPALLDKLKEQQT